MGSQTIKQKIILSLKQTKAWDFLFDETTDEVLYGGAKGGGKTVLLCFSALEYARQLKDYCKITTMPKYPHVIGYLGRLRAVDFSKTTLETFKKMINSELYEYNDQKKELVLFNGLFKYHTGGMDDEENVRKFNSAEYGFIGVDQAEELDRDKAGMLRATQGRAKINDIALPKKILWTANPSICFLKEDFISSDILPGRKFVKALPSDNEFIDSQSYIRQLTESFKHRPELISAYVEGDWDNIQEKGFLLNREDCIIATTLQLPISQRKKTVVSNDPAWLGDKSDEIVFYVLRNNRVIDFKFDNNKDTNNQAAENVKYANNYNASTIIIDRIGVGAGVVDNTKKLNPKSKVIAINSANTAGQLDIDIDKIKEKEHKYFNTRSEMWWEATEIIKDKKFVLPNDEKLINQLCGVKYTIKNGRILIESKEDIKKRLGESPDRADALIQGIWALSKAQFDDYRQSNQSVVTTNERLKFYS